MLPWSRGTSPRVKHGAYNDDCHMDVIADGTGLMEMEKTRDFPRLRSNTTRKKSRGQSIVEFMVLLPLLVMMLSGLIEFGFMLNFYLDLIDGAREIARYGANLDPLLADDLDLTCQYTTYFYRILPCMADQVFSEQVVLNPATDDLVLEILVRPAAPHKELADRVAASGPCSIAAKLVGLQELIVSLAMGEDSATKILSFAETLTEQWCRCLRGAGLDVIVFDSVVAPPMLSPAMYHQAILPLHKKIMSLLADLGQTDRPLIIGGQTTPIVSDLVNSGATMIICDFTENANAFAAALGSDTTIQVRRNVNPQILFGDDDKLLNSARQLAADLALFPRPIAGTGILSYDSNPLKLQVFHDLLGKCVG